MDREEIKIQCLGALERIRIELACVKPSLCGRFIEEAYVAGGAIASLVRGETPNDYDIFLRTSETATEVAAALLERRPACATERAVSFDLDGMSLQIVQAHHGQPAEMVSKFDFLHCRGYYEYATRELVVLDEVESACEESILYYFPSANPVRSFARAIKSDLRCSPSSRRSRSST